MAFRVNKQTRASHTDIHDLNIAPIKGRPRDFLSDTSGRLWPLASAGLGASPVAKRSQVSPLYWLETSNPLYGRIYVWYEIGLQGMASLFFVNTPYRDFAGIFSSSEGVFVVRRKIARWSESNRINTLTPCFQ